MTPLVRRLRLVGASLVLAGGSVHLWLRLDDYGTVAIGWTFVANAAASAVVAAYLVLRNDRVGPAAGIVLSVGSLLGLLLTRVGDGLLGFRETGLNPAPEAALTVAVELLAAAILGLLLVVDRPQRSAPMAPEPARRRDRPLVARPVGRQRRA